jgi:uncharacterized peroxidase-related enzyme
MPHLASLPDAATMLDVYRLDMELARPLLRVQQHIMRGPSPLTPAERELIAAYVSTLNACRFCFGVHSEVARRFGVAENRLAALVEKGPSEAREGKLAALLRYCGKLTETPSRITAADAAAVTAAGWDEEALFHAVRVACLFAFFNRLADGLGLDAAAVDFPRVAQGLADIGYEGRL